MARYERNLKIHFRADMYANDSAYVYELSTPKLEEHGHTALDNLCELRHRIDAQQKKISSIMEKTVLLITETNNSFAGAGRLRYISLFARRRREGKILDKYLLVKRNTITRLRRVNKELRRRRDQEATE